MKNLILIAALLLSGCLLEVAAEPLREVVMTAQGLTVVYSPPANWPPGVRAYAGKRSTNSEILLVYQQGLSGAGACTAAAIIGDNGFLFERTRVNGSSGNDEMQAVAVGEAESPCPFVSLAPITTSIKLEFWAAGGDDVITSRGLNNNLVAKGEGGVDFILVGSASFVGGGLGPNVEIAEAADTSITTMQGGVDNDTLCAYTPANLIGDLGTDAWWGVAGTTASGMEGMTTQAACNFWHAQIMARMND